MNNEQTLNNLIREKIRKHYEIRDAKHTPSGKLSASILSWPLQWQVLKYLGVPQSAIDDYTRVKFLRGSHVEEYIVSQVDSAKIQAEVHYRDVIGFIDLLWNGTPHEIKSVANSKYKWILKNGKADDQNILQGALYALGYPSDIFTIDYIAADDYRITSYTYFTKDYKHEVDTIIDEYNQAIQTQTIPLFVPRYNWQAKPEYSAYPEFMTENRELIDNLVKQYNANWK